MTSKSYAYAVNNFSETSITKIQDFSDSCTFLILGGNHVNALDTRAINRVPCYNEKNQR